MTVGKVGGRSVEGRVSKVAGTEEGIYSACSYQPCSNTCIWETEPEPHTPANALLGRYVTFPPRKDKDLGDAFVTEVKGRRKMKVCYVLLHS